MADTYPYRPGMTSRAGKPCSIGGGSPFMPMAGIAPRERSQLHEVDVGGIVGAVRAGAGNATTPRPDRAYSATSTSTAGYGDALTPTNPATRWPADSAATSARTPGSRLSEGNPGDGGGRRAGRAAGRFDGDPDPVHVGGQVGHQHPL